MIFSSQLMLLVWIFATGVLYAADEPTIAVLEREGQSYVSAKELASVLHIGVKQLPGRAEYAVCFEDRCALMTNVMTEAKGGQLVEIHALAKALNAEAIHSPGARFTKFMFSKSQVENLANLPQPGNFAPDFTLTTLAGKTVSLSDYRGRRVLINSWASWCGCRNDLPAWQKFYVEHGAQHFEILSVAVDIQGAAIVRPYVEKAGVTFPVAIDQTDILGRAFGLKFTPVSILVDELGIIRAQGTGPKQDFLDQVALVLNEPLSDVKTSSHVSTPENRTAELKTRIAKHPDDGDSRVELAGILIAAHNLDDALKQLDDAARIKPDHGMAQFMMGQLLFQQGKKDAALACFRKALEFDPKNWRIRKQIWAIENPDKFYTTRNPDYRWQKEALEKERNPATPASP